MTGQPPAHRLRINGPDMYGFYRAKCACGWPGSPWEQRRDARAEYGRHCAGQREIETR